MLDGLIARLSESSCIGGPVELLCLRSDIRIIGDRMKSTKVLNPRRIVSMLHC